MQADKLFEDGLAARKNEQFELALDLFASAIIANPRHSGAWMFRGLVEDRLGRSFNALFHLNQAVNIENRQDIWNNHGIIAARCGLLADAENSFKKALALGDAFEPHQNLGDIYIRQMRLEDAENEFRQAVNISPDNTDAHGNLARVLIARGKWFTGHTENQWRHRAKYPEWERQRYRAWQGESLNGKTILIYPEGGHGDIIKDFRYTVELSKRNRIKVDYPNIFIASSGPLLSLLQYADGNVIPRYSEPPVKPDYCCGMSDLPLWLKIGPDDVPFKSGYLKAPPGPKPELPDGFKVGLCWLSGRRPLQGWTDRIAAAKSIELEQLAPLFEHKDVSFISLQHSREDSQTIRKLRIAPMPNVEDFADTARLIDELDLVISVDTSVAHLAGAMGKPVWNLIRFDEIVTYPVPMYDSMTFYRQKSPGNWSEAIDRLVNDFVRLRSNQVWPDDLKPDGLSRRSERAA